MTKDCKQMMKINKSSIEKPALYSRCCVMIASNFYITLRKISIFDDMIFKYRSHICNYEYNISTQSQISSPYHNKTINLK